MIFEASTIASVKHTRSFARHLYKKENEIVEVRESFTGSQDQSLLEADLVTLQVLTNLTRGKTGIFHVAISPRQYERMTEGQWQRSMEVIAKEFDLSDQMRLVVFHQKAGRPHIHVFWSLVDVEKGKLIQVGRYKRRLQRLATELEKEFGHELTRRIPNQQSIQMTHADRLQKTRRGKNIKGRKETIRNLWERSETAEQFITSLSSAGYTIAQGEKCKYALVDRDGDVSNLVRQLPTLIKAKDVDARLHEHYHGFLSVEQAREQQKERKAELTAHLEQKLKKQVEKIQKRHGRTRER